MKETPVIDFVITWVDDTDPVWREKKSNYFHLADDEVNSDSRYREWNTLKYWFRGVEKFAPWVRNIYFVTDDQKPEWLNIYHPKLKWVKHTDFIPKEYLPTFNCHTIEWNLHRIEGLSDNFVYFNDDVFLIDKTSPDDFFKNGLPCDLPCLGPLYPNGFFSRMLFNNIELENKHFSLQNSINSNKLKWIKHQPISGILKLFLYGRRNLIPNMVSYHIHTAFLKQTFFKLWEAEYDKIDKTCRNHFRTTDDITTYCVRDWQLLSGQFEPQKPIGQYFRTSSLAYDDECVRYMKHRKGKVICLNDTENEKDFEKHKQIIINEFEKLFPEKSAFEL